MKSWYLNTRKKFELVELKELNYDETLKDFIKIKISLADISASDLSSYNGSTYSNYPIIPSRVATGFVSESNDKTYKKGQKVFLSSKSPLGIKGEQDNGYLSDYVIVNTSNVFVLPEGISEEKAIFIEDIALALTILEKFELEKASYIVLFGSSALNCILGQLAIYYQAIPIIIDNDADRLAIAQECGIYYLINSEEENVLQKVVEITAGKLANYGIINADIQNNLQNLKLFAKKATLCVAGYSKNNLKNKFDLGELLSKEITIKSVNNGNEEIFSAINMLANQVISTENLTAKTESFDNAPTFFETLLNAPMHFKSLVKIK